MGVENNLPQHGDVRVFRYPGRWRLPVALILVSIVFLCISLLVVNSDGGWGAWLSFVFPIAFLALALISLVGTAEIHIGDKSFCRVLVGRAWRRIAWEEVAQIRCFPYYDMSERKWIKIISLVPRQERVRRVSFAARFEGVDEVFHLMNDQANKYRIDILVSENGAYVRRDRLS